MDRHQEIYELHRMPPEEMVARAEGRLAVVETLDDLHAHFARALAEEIEGNNRAGRPTVMILPVGPTGQYPIFVETVNRGGIPLNDCTFFFMDEYADRGGVEVGEDHPESFRGAMRPVWESIRAELRPDPSRVVFPLSSNLYRLKDMIAEAGGIGTCYGGVGIHGHIAFNEPEPGVRHTDPRVVDLNPYTVTMNAIRAGVGGDLENFPRRALTLGMNQCLDARRIRLYVRNDIPDLQWANTVLRLAVLGRPGPDYPVTYVREHPDWAVVTDRNTAAPAEHTLEPFGVPEDL
jgi:glucosamine-6-phosphate deaminase